ncbi:Hsp70 family protein, partial [Amycolatopsis sp. H20-H5]|nr:Hsp70 family protein [Amycolatopsis sp. H20-H5]
PQQHQPQQQRPQPPVPPAKSKRKPLLIGAGALVLVAVVVAAVLFATNGSKSPPANAAGANGAAVDKASCEQVGKKDEQGFTDCLRQLAGPVAQKATCQGAAISAQTIGAVVAVSCQFKSEARGATRAVTYYQGISSDSLAVGVKLQLGDNPEEGTWAGGGLTGKYLAGVGSAAGIVLFGVDDRQLCGMLVSVDLGGKQQLPELVKFFTEQLKPA